MGRGSLSDPKVNLTKTVKLLKSGDPPVNFFGKLFPDLAFANNTELCIPDCAHSPDRSSTKLRTVRSYGAGVAPACGEKESFG
jgi:hypothetical protein